MKFKCRNSLNYITIIQLISSRSASFNCTLEPLYLCFSVALNLCFFGPLDLWIFGLLRTFDPLDLCISELLDLSRSRIQDSGIGIENSRKRLSYFNCISIISWFNHCNSFNCIQVSKFVQLYYNYTINLLVVILTMLHAIVPWNHCTFVSLYFWTFVSLDLWIFGSLDC